ncbi:hypothetical protein SLA2020_279240 [Shorea laevis]
MKFIAWNCRGLGRGTAMRALRSLIRTHRSDLVFLCEVKLNAPSVQRKLLRLGFPFCLKFHQLELRVDWLWLGMLM